jgi:hypothetical protein
MADAVIGTCRSTWLIDPGIGNLLSRGQMLAQVDGLYSHFGLSRQCLWYAPEVLLDLTSNDSFQSAGCTMYYTEYYGVCDPGRVTTTPPHTMSYDFGYRPVALHAYSYAGNPILRVCGNFSVPQNRPGGQAPAPVPVMRGRKFEDANHNHVQDVDETGIADWTIQLTRTSSLFGDQPTGIVTTTTTGADGTYSFRLDGAGPGTYTVTELPRDRWEPTTGVTRTIVVGEGIGDQAIDVPAFGNAYINHPPLARTYVILVGPFG